MTTWSLCQTEGPETSLTNYVDAPKHGIHPHNAASSQSLNNKGQLRLHSLRITPLILATMSKMTNSTPSNDSHRTICCLSAKNYVYNIEAGIHKLEFTAYIDLTVYSGILQGSLQKVLKVGTVLLWSWQMHVWSTLTLSFCPMTGWHINWGLYTFGKQPYSIQILDRALSLTFIRWCCKWP